ncbi:MAG TPA: phytoene/squalene synthase family protein [Ignavibacteria bacterium]|nr:phytoene/squalene synthase family protein [Ignavibacteria bacterium]
MSAKIIIPDFLKGKFCEYRRYTKHYAKSFYFSSFALPKDKRNAAYAIYSFCRFADNITDVTGYESSEYLGDKIKRLRALLSEVYRQAETDSKNISDFTATIRRYDIPKAYFDDLIDGVSADISKKRYATYSELDEYCYKVASVVGLIMTRVFGYSTDDAFTHAINLGKAMQLTNIIRDISDDYSMGRIYIPEEEMRTFGYTEKDLKNRIINDNFRNLMKHQIARARNYYTSANKGIGFLTNDGSRSTVKMMSKIYAGILDEIESKNYDVFSKRHYVSTTKKIAMSASLFLIRILSARRFKHIGFVSESAVNSPEYT